VFRVVRFASVYCFCIDPLLFSFRNEPDLSAVSKVLVSSDGLVFFWFFFVFCGT
jgi:hypothetical protein